MVAKNEQSIDTINAQKLSDQVVESWEKVGLLKATEGDFKKKQLAYLLENQKNYNSMINEGKSIMEFPPFFHQNIPAIVRIYNNFIGPKIVSIQTIQQTDQVKYKNLNGQMQSVSITRGQRRLKSQWVQPTFVENKHINLGRMADATIELMEGVVTELNREIISDLQQIAGSVSTHFWKAPKNLFDAILMASSGLSRKIGTAANWLIVSSCIGDELAKLEEWVSHSEDNPSFILARKAGKLAKKWDVYVDPLMENETILLGYKGDEYQSGYFYCPSIMLDQDENGFILTRYGKKMLDAGYYAKINLENYSSNLEEWYPELEPTLPEPELVEEPTEELVGV